MKGKIRQLARHPEAILAFGVIGLILLLVLPLPYIVLDALLSISIVLSVITLLLTLYIENALEFSAFPSLLLCMTLFRLGLNIASTRMILLDARAGDIITAFGGFVTRDNFLVGMILFLLLTLINFIVVTKGASRIAEVAARFTLEALPGKQMGIDAELNARMLAPDEAKKRRKKIAEEAEFYGAMDGASKFVKGDAIAALIITLVNLFGGLAIGVGVNHLSFYESIETYSLLTIGDGLVSQIPALLVSLAAGMMVTRASSGSLGLTLPQQVFYNPKVLFISGLLLLFLGLLPGMPGKVMIPLALILMFVGWVRLKEKKEEPKEHKNDDEEIVQEDVEKALLVHPLEIELGIHLLANAEELLGEMKGIRSRIAKKLGILVPPIHISDSLEMEVTCYQFKIKGVSIFCGKLKKGDKEEIHKLVNGLEEQIESHAHELLNRQEVARLVKNAKAYDSAVVDELIPKKITLGVLLKVLQNLLKESIAIRDIVSILEILADNIPENPKEELTNPDLLSEHVRRGLSRGISEAVFGKNQIVHAITIDPKVEQMIALAVNGGNQLIRPSTSIKITSALLRLTKAAKEEGVFPVVLTQASSRLHLRRIVEKHLPHLPILSYNELSDEKTIKTIGKVTNDVLL